jgi:hypothetical protein
MSNKDTISMFVDMESEEEEESMLQEAIVKLIDKALKERLVELAIDDIQMIAKELMPDFDRMIAEKVKGHFYEIGSFLVGKFGNMEEGE